MAGSMGGAGRLYRQVCSLALAVLILLPYASPQSYIPPELVKLNDTMLKTYYDDLPICLMRDSTRVHNESFWDVLDGCRKKGFGAARYGDGFYTLPSSAFANKQRGTCCTEDVPIGDRGFDEVVRGYEDGGVNYMVELLELLSATNRSLVLLGDSMNTQVFHAMMEEINRGGYGSMNKHDFQNRWWSQPDGYERVGMDSSIVYHVMLDVVLWTKEGMNPVTLYNMNLYYHNTLIHHETMLLRVLIPFLSTHEHPAGLLILANIGHHLEGERNSREKRVMHSKMSEHITWLHDMTLVNPKNVVAFRETTPSHFNSPDLDGSYEKWHSSPNKDYNFENPNPWDNSLYYCRAIEHLDQPWRSNTPENVAAERILQTWTATSVKVRDSATCLRC